MPDKYRYSGVDLISSTFNANRKFNDLTNTLKIQMGPRCDKCFDYVDKTLKIYIRSNHKITGPNQLCRRCISGMPDEKFEATWKKQMEGKRIIYDTDKIARREKKKAMDSEMDIYRRKAEENE